MIPYQSFVIIPILLSILSLTTFSLIIINCKLTKISLSWSVMNFFVSVWFISFSIIITTSSQQTAILFRYFMDFSAIFASYLWFLFTKYFCNTNNQFLNISSLILFLTTVLLNFSSYFIADMVPKLDFNYYVNANIGYFIFLFFVIYSLFSGSYLLISKIISTKSNREREPLKWILYSSIIGFIGLGGAFLPSIGIMIKPYSIILFSLFFIFTTYTIYKHEIFGTRFYLLQIFISILWMFLAIKILLEYKITGVFFAVSVSTTLITLSVLTLLSVRAEIKTDHQIDETEKLIDFRAFIARRIIYSRSLEGKFDYYLRPQRWYWFRNRPFF